MSELTHTSPNKQQASRPATEANKRTTPSDFIQPAGKARTRHDNIPGRTNHALLERFGRIDGSVMVASKEVYPLSDIPIGWMRSDPTPARAVLAYYDSNGHLFCYAANMNTEFVQFKPTDDHLQVQKSGRDNSWKLNTDSENAKVELRDMLNTTTWFEEVWNFVREEVKKVDAALHLPFRDAADYIHNYPLRDMYMMADRMGTEFPSFDQPPVSRYGESNAVRGAKFEGLVRHLEQFKDTAEDILYECNTLNWSEDALEDAEHELWSIFGRVVCRWLDERGSRKNNTELDQPSV